MTRVLYVILTHHRYDQVAALVELLASGGGQVLIHPNPAAEPWEGTPTGRLVRDGVARVVRAPVAVTWGNATIFHAVLRSWEEALEYDDWEWGAHLSGQDFPLLAPRDHAALLGESTHDAWLDVKRVPLDGNDERPGFGAPNDEILKRHAFTYFFLRGRLAARVPVRAKHAGVVTYRKASDDMLAFGVRTFTASGLDRLFGRGLHFGSSWMDLRRDVIEHVLWRIRNERRVGRLASRTIHPDETILPSLVMEAAGDPNSRDNHRYVKWLDDESGHTSVIGPEDLEAALASGAFLGRRFDFRAHPDVLETLLPVVSGPSSLLEYVTPA